MVDVLIRDSRLNLELIDYDSSMFRADQVRLYLDRTANNASYQKKKKLHKIQTIRSNQRARLVGPVGPSFNINIYVRSIIDVEC